MLLAFAAFPESVDPCFPEQWHTRQAAETRSLTRWPPARIHQLEAEKIRLQKKIAVLPQHDPKVLPDHLGYHSSCEIPGSEGSSPVSTIDLKMEWPRMVSIAMAPAFNPQEPGDGPYAFPTRFKIEVRDAGSGTFSEVVNWMDEDFPDPGPYPVFFSDINLTIDQVRITVPRVERESGVAYFALGELYLFLEQEGQLADNMAVWASVDVSESESFDMPPLWDGRYLCDNIVGLGVPLSGEKNSVKDLVIPYENESLSEPVQIVLDLGQMQKVGRVDLWPAEAPYLLAIPSIGFPREITLELSADPEFKTSETIHVENVGRRMQREDRLSVLCRAYKARYVRIVMDDLPEFMGQRMLGLGEISVSEYGQVFSVGCDVSSKGIPAGYVDQLPRLVDGYTRSRRILPDGEWIKGLAYRRPLDRRLARVEDELVEAREAWRRMELQFSIWIGGLLCIGLLGAMGLQRLQRRRILKKLKLRITRDLHDEVGSNLGSITLAAKRMEDAGSSPEDLSELSLMAREASASLRDVVWLTDQSVIRLPALLQKLAERAERILSGVELSIDLAPDCPGRIVPLTFKRHLILFFKEAVHNCARHSHATWVRIVIAAGEEQLTLSVQDNGCGFDPSQKSDGWGVDSMQKRAHELGGTMVLQSTPGNGTTVSLTIPLSTLMKKTDYLYKTSN
ncbi:sensor histidine kinase [Tichowtungia aerotolerans]|uniref:Oxygen sensor histidine kinase NreB n=1 Tax=Tichowtungia aerotolerans TaxID=2697043 RepID=A0A6P1M8V7_9BACT|nr:ATP-binding protein [Tichowtungia aerotolerans]QHI70321.1 hypothetical protein GT409_13010 [Tichowtungia aerotolerans]